MSEVAELVRGAYAAFSRGDIDAVLDLLHPDVEWIPPSDSTEPEPLRGREAVREYLAPNIFEEQRGEPVEVIEEGNRLLVAARMRARARASGIELDQIVYHVYTIEEGLAVRFSAHIDRNEALAALREPYGRPAE
jgi:ketosteroid isomerase-like protein